MSLVKNIIAIVCFCGMLFGAYIMGRKSVHVVTESTKVIDTVKVFAPTLVATQSRVVEVRVPKLVFVPADTVVREVFVPVGDDSVKIQVNVETREYRDSSYYAVVSGAAIGGIRPTLDYIETYNTTINTVQTVRKRPKFAFTAGIGYGYTPKGFQPYAGVNFGFVLWSF